MSYTLNPFDLLGDEGDERPRKQVPKQAAPKPTTTAAKPAAPTNKAAPQQAPSQQQKPAAPAKAASAPAPSSAPKKDTNEVKKPQGDAPKGKTDYAKKPQSSQQGGAPRGGKDEHYESEKPVRAPKDKKEGGRERAPQRGRQFDRRSGTGRPANENKRAGSGRGNWGKLSEGQEPTEGAATKEQPDGEKDEAVPADAEVAAEGEAEIPKEPEYKGLDEYLESLKGKTVRGVEAPKLRVAGEGVDQSAWSNYAPLARDEEAEPVKKKKSETKKETANGKEGKEEKVSVEKLFRVTMPRPQGIEERRDRRGAGGDRRGGRGGGGGGGGKGSRGPRGGDRVGKPAQTDAKPTQANGGEAARFLDADFPALGGSGGVAAPAPAQQSPTPIKA